MKKIKKVVLTIAVLSLTSSICAGLDFDKPMYDCGSYGEYFMSCSRTLPNGEKQGGAGVCKCRNHKWEGGCVIPEAKYTEYKVTLLESCERTCSLGRTVKGCGGIEELTEEEPVCGEWVCTDNYNKEDSAECIVGEIKYTPGNCSYSTQVCCSDGKWSEADELCK